MLYVLSGFCRWRISGLYLMAIVWFVIAAIVALTYPKHLLVFVLYGVVGFVSRYVTYVFYAGRSIAGKIRLLFGVILLLIPSTNTIVPRIWRDLVLDLSSNNLFVIFLLEVFLPLILLGILLYKTPGRQLMRSIPYSLGIAGVLMLAGAFLSSLASIHPLRSVGASILEVVVPISMFVLTRAIATNRRSILWILIMLSLGSIIPSALGVASVVKTFGFPLTATDFLKIKMGINFSGDYGVATFGNSGHMADFVVLIGPILAVLSTNRSIPVHLKTISIGALFLAFINLLVTFSRAALLITLLWLIVLMVKQFYETNRTSVLLGANALFLIAVILSPSSARYFGNSMYDAGREAAILFGNTEPESGQKLDKNDSSSRVVTANTKMEPKLEDKIGVTDYSAPLRVQALSEGVRLGLQYGLLGAGYSEYPRLDPVHTSPHSLLIRTWVEGGCISAAGIFVVFGCALWRVIAQCFTEKGSEWDELSFASSLAVTCYLFYGFVFGSLISLDGMGLWGMLLGVFLALACGNKNGGLRSQVQHG